LIRQRSYFFVLLQCLMGCKFLYFVVL